MVSIFVAISSAEMRFRTGGYLLLPVVKVAIEDDMRRVRCDGDVPGTCKPQPVFEQPWCVSVEGFLTKLWRSLGAIRATRHRG